MDSNADYRKRLLELMNLHAGLPHRFSGTLAERLLWRIEADMLEALQKATLAHAE